MPALYRCIVISIFFYLIPINLFSQGLKIKGNDHLIDERTSYSVFETKRPVFSDKLDISFEMTLPTATIGYILRIKNEEENYIYNLLVNDQGDSMRFSFSHEGYDVKINAYPDSMKIREKQWIKIYMSFDLKKDSLMLQINNDRYYTGNLRLKEKWNPTIYFGRSDYVIDVPSFVMRNLVIKDNKQEYCFPLDESRGELVHNNKKEVIGHVSNPVWIINEAYHWKSLETYFSKSVAGTNFNSDTQEIYYFNTDSIVFYNVRMGMSKAYKYANKCPMTLRLGTNFIDKTNGKLYVYEVADLPEGDISMACLDLETLLWTNKSSKLLPTQLHHHGNYFDEENRRYIIFGGFGNVKYNKWFYSYSLDDDSWNVLPVTGDVISPRYFTSMGYDRFSKSLYVFGGMGNESGDQSVGRRYFYDLYKVDLETNNVTKLWEISWKEENVVPVRNLVVADDSTFYTLCYPEHFSNSELRLYKFSIATGEHTIVGDSIPIRSEKITTNANLYYNESFSELFDIQLEFEDDDIASNTNIYRLLYPPVTLSQLNAYVASEPDDNIIIIEVILIIIAVLAIFCFVVIRRLRHKKQYSRPTIALSGDEDISTYYQEDWELSTQANAIYLFGEFAVFDRRNKNITYQFSTKLKQAFLLILQYSAENGISSQLFSEMLWPDKQSEKDKVKNLRGVTLNHLRKILKELDGVTLIHENGVFKLLFEKKSYCDYFRVLEIISSVHENAYLTEIAAITSRGKFLDSFDQPMFDSFKDTVERKIDPILSSHIKNEFDTENYHLALSLSRAFLNIDPINEDGLYYMLRSLLKLGREDQARKCYAKFVAEYKLMMGEDFPKTYSDILL